MIFPLQMAFSYRWYVWFDHGRFHHNYHAYRVFISQILQGEGNGGIVPLKSRANLQKEPGWIWFAEHRGIKHVWLVGYLPASAFTILNALEVWFSELRSLSVVNALFGKLSWQILNSPQDCYVSGTIGLAYVGTLCQMEKPLGAEMAMGQRCELSQLFFGYRWYRL